MWLDLRSIHDHRHASLAVVWYRAIHPDWRGIIDLHVEHRTVSRLTGPERVGNRLARTLEAAVADIVASSEMEGKDVSRLCLDRVGGELRLVWPGTNDNIECRCVCLVEEGQPSGVKE